MSKLRVMYVGDIMGAPGREVALQRVPALRKKYNVGLVIAQAENVSHGKSMTTGHLHQLQTGGIDFFTGGNHTIERPTMLALLDDPNVPVIAPINQPGVKPAWGAKTLHTPVGDVCIISLLGTTFPLADAPLDNPLLAIDRALAAIARQPFVAKIVNFHGDFSSEKRVIGFYLDGRVSAVIGDHWHVPTADAMVLPGGTRILPT